MVVVGPGPGFVTRPIPDPALPPERTWLDRRPAPGARGSASVRWRDLDSGAEGTDPFDDLVYATGSVPMRPPVPGIDAAGVYGVQVLDDGAALRAELDRESVRRVVVIGGGYVGLEIAEACRMR